MQRLMREMGLEAIYPKPHLSKAGEDRPVYPVRNNAPLEFLTG